MLRARSFDGGGSIGGADWRIAPLAFPSLQTAPANASIIPRLSRRPILCIDPSIVLYVLQNTLPADSQLCESKHQD
jgi:hypothetical protein